MPPGPWAMSVMMQKLHPSATSAANSVMSPPGVIRAILAGALVNSVPSVNQRLPSEPLVMSLGWLSAVGTRNCFSLAPAAASASPAENASTAATAAASKRPVRRDMSPTHAPIGRLLPARYVPDVGPSLRVPERGFRAWLGQACDRCGACNAAIWLLLETSDSCWCAPVALRLSNVTGS